MITPTTVSESFIRWMSSNGYGVEGESIFLNQIPDQGADGKPIDNAYWVVTAGGNVASKNVSAESIQRFSTQVFYRNKSGEEVEHNLFALNQQVNARGIFEIEGFTLYDIEATMPTDNDRDAENRRQASLVVAIQIYVNYVS